MEAFKQELLHRSLRWAQVLLCCLQCLFLLSQNVSLQPVAETDNVKSEPSSSLSAQQPHPRDSSACGPSGQGRSNHRWAAGVSADGCASLSEESYIESDARLAMQLSMQVCALFIKCWYTRGPLFINCQYTRGRASLTRLTFRSLSAPATPSPRKTFR
jgi:hypothetical protein